MLTEKANIDFNKWFNLKYKNCVVGTIQESASSPIYEMMLNEIILTEKIDSCIVIEWFDEIDSAEIGGHSISDMIYINLKNNKNIFESISIAIKTANKNYNEIKKNE